MGNSSVEVQISDPFEDNVRQFRIIMNSIGILLSFLGYGVMVLTAILFPTWRKTKQNQLWLHMCGTFIVYFCLHFSTYVRPIPEARISIAVEHLNKYLIRVSLCWMLAGAWLTYKNLVDVFADLGDDFIKRSAYFCYIIPLPFAIAMYILYICHHDYDMHEIRIGCNYYHEGINFEYTNVYWILTCLLDNSLLVVPIIGSLSLYVCVTYSICNNRKVYGHERDFVGTVALGFYFVFTCCVQCAIITAKFMFSLSGIWSYAAIILMSFHVSTYTIFFVFCNKMTRETWSKYLKSKLSNSELQFHNTKSSTKSLAVAVI